MEWERAKNYILVFFVLLNLGLGILWFMEYERYTMSAEQERIIHAILGRNNISMYTRPMRRSPPMNPLNVSGFYYNVDALLEIFFENPIQITRTEDRYEYKEDEEREDDEDPNTLVISNGFIFYNNTSPYGFRNSGQVFFLENMSITRHIATALTDTFIENYFPDFVQDSVFYTDGEVSGVRVIYRQAYRGRLVHSNFIELLVTAQGIRQIEMQFGKILGHGGTSRMIFAPDEALLTFVQRIHHLAQEEPIVITHMDLVYFTEYFGSVQQGTINSAEPFYRIFIQGSDRPFLINAYTNVIID